MSQIRREHLVRIVREQGNPTMADLRAATGLSPSSLSTDTDYLVRIREIVRFKDANGVQRFKAADEVPALAKILLPKTLPVASRSRVHYGDGAVRHPTPRSPWFGYQSSLCSDLTL